MKVHMNVPFLPQDAYFFFRSGIIPKLPEVFLQGRQEAGKERILPSCQA